MRAALGVRTGPAAEPATLRRQGWQHVVLVWFPVGLALGCVTAIVDV